MQLAIYDLKLFAMRFLYSRLLVRKSDSFTIGEGKSGFLFSW